MGGSMGKGGISEKVSEKILAVLPFENRVEGLLIEASWKNER